MKNVAHEIIKLAAEAGYFLTVQSEGITDYEGKSHVKAWEAVKAVEECTVYIDNDAEGIKLGYLFVIPGLDPEETVADYADANGQTWIDTQWKRIFQENEAA